MNGTNRDKTQDNLNFSENISQYKDEKGLSWFELAKEIYYKLTEDDESECSYLSAYEEEEIIKKFSDNLKKAVERNQKNTKMGTRKVFLKDICKALELNSYSLPIIKKELPAKEKYIEMNTGILYEKEVLWEDFIEKALPEVEEAANEGFKEAQTTLAHFYYYYGKNSIKNPLKSIELYKRAAEQDDELAIYQLGLIYEYGVESIEPNRDMAYKYYLQSAKHNFPLAFNKLAFYSYSAGSYPDFFKYAKKAEEYNDVVGMLYLAYAYKKGIGTEINIEKAIEVYEKLCENNDAKKYSMEIYFPLAELYKHISETSKAEKYLNKFIETWEDMIKTLWDEEQMSIISLLYSSSPERNNNILKASHYDYLNSPDKPTILKAIINI